MANRAQQAAVGLGQLTLDAGGATVDTSIITSVKWGKDTRDLPGEFKKGSDVRVTLLCRVTGVPVDDLYDGHGNIKETVRGHKLRVDEVEKVELVKRDAFTLAPDESDEGPDEG